MRNNAQLRHEVAVVQRYLASLRTPADDRSGRFTRRRPPAPDVDAIVRASAAGAAKRQQPRSLR